jgi:hypothetical protein
VNGLNILLMGLGGERKMAKSKLSILKDELRERQRILQEDIDDIQCSDEYDPKIYQETVLEIEFLNKTLNRIWDIEYPS